ncbi:hypothetical protein A2U01_0002537 [Trifolium medium]|uniref:Uncharacterized protein n=1 Tax=Trifolium medium TaxID=97028 RepID=A0A392M3A9_9FABA|nr:hypothetical protein [Trifolium medium]
MREKGSKMTKVNLKEDCPGGACIAVMFLAVDEVEEDDESGELSSFWFRDGPELPSANLEEVESLLGEKVTFECIFHNSPPA